MASLINRSKVKKFALDTANQQTPIKGPKKWRDSQGKEWDMQRCLSLSSENRFTQVSKEFLDSIDGEVRNMIKKRVKKLPPVGKTVR